MDSLTRHNDKPSIEPGPAPSHEAGEQDKVAKEDNNRLRRSKQLPVGIPMEAAASHLLTAGVGWLALKFWRMFKRQQREVQVASEQLKLAQAQLREKESKVEMLEGTLVRDVQKKEIELDQTQNRLISADEELKSATSKCKEAASFLERTMSDLRVTETELRGARAQLQFAFDQLSSTRGKLEETQGELGLTKSENEILKRELFNMRRQLEAAQCQMERYHLDSTKTVPESWGVI